MSKNRTQYVILSLLRIQPCTGQEIHEFCNTRFSYFWQESYGQIYPNLNKLEEQGHAKKLPNATKRNAKYEITKKGLSKLEKWIQEEPSPRIIRDELFLKIFCGSAVSNLLHLDHVGNAKESARKEKAALKKVFVELDQMEGSHPDVKYWRLILQAGLYSLDARIKWCDMVEKELAGESK